MPQFMSPRDLLENDTAMQLGILKIDVEINQIDEQLVDVSAIP